MVDFNIEIATLDDLNDVMKIYKDATRAMAQESIHQWDDEYPNRSTVAADIMDRCLYLCKLHGNTVCTFVLNRRCNDKFNDIKWQFPEDSYFVMHRICVAAEKQHKGMGTCAMIKAEKILKDKGIESLRMAVYVGNTHAVKMCKRLGYRVSGTATLHGMECDLMEKKVLK